MTQINQPGAGPETSGPTVVPPESVEAEALAAPKAATEDDRPPVPRSYVVLLILALFGANLAFTTPLVLSLAIQIQALAPQNEEYLGFVLGTAAGLGLIVGPMFGVLSDRTRSRLGRRRPWMVAGLAVGLVGLFILAIAPNVVVLAIGWIISTLGWGQIFGGLQNSQADRLPASQRGKVAGLTGMAGMMAPVIGSVAGSALSSSPYLLFLVPGLIGAVLVVLFLLFVQEPDSRDFIFEEKLSAGGLFSKYLYNPRSYPDFSWNFVGRFVFYFGLTLSSAFTAFFLASRLNLPITQIGGTIALVGLLGIVATTAGAIGGGFLSDRFKQRKVFVLAGGVIFSVGAVMTAFAPSIEFIVIGSFLSSVGIGVFSAVDQALVLDVLPERDTQAARFNALNSFSLTVPQSLAPIAAPAFLVIGMVSGGDKNYSVLYLIAAVLTIIGGLIVVTKVKSVR